MVSVVDAWYSVDGTPYDGGTYPGNRYVALSSRVLR